MSEKREGGEKRGRRGEWDEEGENRERREEGGEQIRKIGGRKRKKK